MNSTTMYDFEDPKAYQLTAYPHMEILNCKISTKAFNLTLALDLNMNYKEQKTISSCIHSHEG